MKDVRSPDDQRVLDDPTALILPKRKARSLTLDADEVVKDVLKRLNSDLNNRTEWMNNQLRRYAKYRGWMERKTWQFEDASVSHLPITMYTCQRISDALYNASISQRPIMQSKAMKQEDIPKERRIDHLMDYQLFVYANAANILADLIDHLVVDGTVHVMIPWVRGEQTIRLFHRLPAIPHDADVLAYILMQLTEIYGEGTTLMSRKDHHFNLHTPDGSIDVEVYEGLDGDLEVIEQRDIRIDHLSLSVEDLEDIVVPPNCSNPQPPSESNPRGAHHVFRLCSVSLDTVHARQQTGVYDLLSDADFESISLWIDAQQSSDVSQPKQQKDDLEGVNTQSPIGKHETVTIIEAYDRWDVNGDGLEEDVIFWIVCNAAYTEGRLARARYLTEIVPPGPHGARRPIEKFELFPVPNRYYGIGMPELVEGCQDLMNTLFNFGVDAGVIANMPWFFYRAASGMKAEMLRLNPGEGYPLDDPRADVFFPQLPQAQGSWVFQELALLNQFLERLTMLGQLQFGGIPQGKASAFRTTGTTQAVLQQGDTRIERVLRRLMEGLSRVWDQGLALTQRYLPPSTEYRVLGVPESQETFDRIVDRKDIAGQFRFFWNATVLNANPLVKQQRALSLMQVVANPLALQLQLTGPDEIYRATRRYIDTLEEPNPDQYLKRPLGVSSGPKITAEEAISMILSGKSPTEVNPVESIQEHAQKLVQFMQSDHLGLFDAQQTALFGQYLQKVMESATRIQQQAQTQQAAGAFQQMLGGPGGNGGGPPPGQPSPEATMMSAATPLEAGEGPQGGM